MITIGVTAIGSGIGLAVLRSLRLAHLPTRVVGLEVDSAAVAMRWCDAASLVPRADSPDYVDEVLSVCSHHGIEILIPGSEPELPVLAGARARFVAAGITVIVAPAVVVDLCIDKLVGGEFVTSRGLPFVPTHDLPAAHRDADTLRYPVIAKPRFGAGSVGARVVPDAMALLAIDPHLDLVVQPYAGDPPRANRGDALNQTDEFSLQYAIGDSGMILGRFGSIGSLKGGMPWAGRPVQDDTLLDQGDATVRALIGLGASGPVNLQGRITDGRVTFFEMNARFTGITSMRSALGFREVEAAIHSLAFGDDQQARACLGPVADRRMSRYLGEVFVTPRTAPDPAPQPALAPRILVTGASGYLGREITRRLAAEPWVAGVVAGVRTAGSAVEPGVAVAVADLPETVWDLSEVNTIVHTAALRPVPGGPLDEGAAYRVNAAGTAHLARLARDRGIGRFVYLSSQAVYGTGRPPPWSEADPPRPETPYAFSKWMGEVLVREVGIPTTVILRLARVYGFGDGLDWEGVPHRFAAQVGTGDPITLHGRGEGRVDLVHLADAVDAVVAACREPLPPATILNIGSGRPASVREVVDACVAIGRDLGLDPRITASPPPGTRADFGMDIERARSQLSWGPRIPLEDGLRELILAAAG